MKSTFYTAALLILIVSCKHQQSIASSNSSSSSTSTSSYSHTDSTATSTGWTTTTTQGQVTITTDESTSATIIVTNPPDTVVTSPVPADTAQVIYRLTVSFISKGAGINYQAEESFENWLKSQPKHPAYEKTHWGREGETNFCLKLDELSTREQDIFVRDARTQLADKELVFVTEYAPCKGVKE